MNKNKKSATTIASKEINLTTGVYHMNNQQLSASLERAWETERENKETEALFERDEPNED
ncbi:hypothetical protein [Pediococcus acidilactici]|uniref:hypothetical protein n=1 Tax=Pediococcus acidilactici TaxID=1254 RepID=UPI001329228C|nr:hypothetical protein [Pediococcus acidilactici]KAF0513433.1 hypothetical protein GBP27_08890 [Pediococcus acidilactici]KAF0552928.1 hypothetical protein GBP50_10425 [Pediococcus acidilactici]KAF0564160.1 hypothetical protein GBP53_10265 [Pediococcus acidilactici]